MSGCSPTGNSPKLYKYCHLVSENKMTFWVGWGSRAKLTLTRSNKYFNWLKEYFFNSNWQLTAILHIWSSDGKQNTEADGTFGLLFFFFCSLQAGGFRFGLNFMNTRSTQIDTDLFHLKVRFKCFRYMQRYNFVFSVEILWIHNMLIFFFLYTQGKKQHAVLFFLLLVLKWVCGSCVCVLFFFCRTMQRAFSVFKISGSFHATLKIDARIYNCATWAQICLRPPPWKCR